MAEHEDFPNFDDDPSYTVVDDETEDFDSFAAEKLKRKKGPRGKISEFLQENPFILEENEQMLFAKVASKYEEVYTDKRHRIVYLGYVKNSDSTKARLIRDQEQHSLWTLLADGKIPLSVDNEWQMYECLENLNKNSIYLDEDELRIVVFNSRLPWIRASEKQKFSDRLLAECLLAYDIHSISNKGLKSRAENFQRRLAAIYPGRDEIGSELLILSALNRERWESTDQNEAEQFEKNLYLDGIATPSNTETPSEWAQQWQKAFGEMWPERWTVRSRFDSDMITLRKRGIRLSDKLLQALLLHEKEAYVNEATSNQPLSIELMKLYFDRCPTGWMMADFFHTQVALGTHPLDIVKAYESSRLFGKKGIKYEKERQLEKKHTVENIQQASKDPNTSFIHKGRRVMHQIRQFGNRFRRGERKNDEHYKYDGELSTSIPEFEDEIDLDTLLSTMDQHNERSETEL